MPESLDERLANRRKPGDSDYDAFYDATDGELAAMVPPRPVSADERNARLDGPIHGYFGLTYSNYLVLHRSLMQSMPVEWQERAVAVFEELQAAFRHIEHPDTYEVTAAVEVEYGDLSDADRLALGVTRSDEDGDPDEDSSVFRYYDKDGTEHESWERVLVPRRGGDPLPHYNRGRTFVEPREVAGLSSSETGA